MSDCRFGVSPVNYPDPDPDPNKGKLIQSPSSYILNGGYLIHFFFLLLLLYSKNVYAFEQFISCL